VEDTAEMDSDEPLQLVASVGLGASQALEQQLGKLLQNGCWEDAGTVAHHVGCSEEHFCAVVDVEEGRWGNSALFVATVAASHVFYVGQAAAGGPGVELGVQREMVALVEGLGPPAVQALCADSTVGGKAEGQFAQVCSWLERSEVLRESVRAAVNYSRGFPPPRPQGVAEELLRSWVRRIYRRLPMELAVGPEVGGFEPENGWLAFYVQRDNGTKTLLLPHVCHACVDEIRSRCAHDGPPFWLL
jgi:hypothetical protein